MARNKRYLRDTLLHEPVFTMHLPIRSRAVYAELWVELRRQREALLCETNCGVIQTVGPELSSDPADQASIDQEQEWSLLVKARTRDKLRQIDMALDRMERSTYGLCVRCRQEIPIARLKVQPAALQCAPCRELDEQSRSAVKPLSYAG
jgi:DnaK suppressor protein